MIKKSQILMDLKADLRSSEIKKRDMDAIRTVYKNEYDGKPYGNEVSGKSQIVSRDIKKQDEWQHASVKDPFVSTSDIIKCSPVTFEDKAAATQNELVLNTQFCRQFNRYSFMTKALKVLGREGTCVIQTGWDYEDEEVEVEMPITMMNPYTGEEEEVGSRTETQTKIIKNQPTAQVRRNEDIYVDPTCKDDMDECQFVIVRYESSLSMLKSDGRYKNLDKVALSSSEATNNSNDYYPEDESNFNFSDEARKKLIVHEYWGNYDMNEDGIAEPVVCVWVGSVIIRLESNPYPDQKIPFIIVPYSSVPFQMEGETNAEMLSDTQKVKTALLRGTIDNMAQSTNGQKGIKKGSLDVMNKKRFLGGQNYEFNGAPSDFIEGHFNPIPGSAFDMYSLMSNEAESMTGGFSHGNGSGKSLGGSATAARGALDATAARRLDIVRNVSENMLKPLLRKWMSYNTEFLEPDQVMRITNDEFVPVRRDDLQGNIDIDIEVSTSEDNAAKAQELSFMMQTVGPNEDPGIRKIIMADIMRLHKMPDLAKKMMEYQPEPDQYVEQMKQLEMQKLQVEMYERKSRAEENQVDMRLKGAKADSEEAKSRLTHSKSDMEDLNYLEKESGADKQYAAQMQDDKRLGKMDEIALQGMQQEHLAPKEGLAKSGGKK